MNISKTLSLYLDFINTENNREKLNALSNYSEEEKTCDLFYDGYHDQIIFLIDSEQKIWTSAEYDDVFDDLDRIQSEIDLAYKKIS